MCQTLGHSWIIFVLMRSETAPEVSSEAERLMSIDLFIAFSIIRKRLEAVKPSLQAMMEGLMYFSSISSTTA